MHTGCLPMLVIWSENRSIFLFSSMIWYSRRLTRSEAVLFFVQNPVKPGDRLFYLVLMS
jgi:hypothetical protein